MRIGLIAVDSNHPNLAIMKLSAYHKNLGDEVEWYDPATETYDIVYMSKIFNFKPDYDKPVNAREVIKGGTGYSITKELPPEVDRLQPDYSIYPDIDDRTSYGFLTRGCPNHCKWCVVPKKEGPVRPYMDIDEVTQNGKRHYVILMDNNIVASEYGVEQMAKIADRKYHVDYNQALDARLVTPEIAKILARTKFINYFVRFGCDTHGQMKDCERVIRQMIDYGFTGQFQLYCIIINDIDECVDRISYWKHDPLFKAKVRVNAQPYRNPYAGTLAPPPSWQRHLARWANRKEFYCKSEFRDFQFTKEITGATYLDSPRDDKNNPTIITKHGKIIYSLSDGEGD